MGLAWNNRSQEINTNDIVLGQREAIDQKIGAANNLTTT